MELTSVIVKPYFTEKTYVLRNAFANEKIAFLVNKKANKHQIGLAFEAIYGVKPLKIATVNHHGAAMRTMSARPGFSKDFKIAYITLPEGVKVAITSEEIEEANKAKADSKKEAKSE